MQCWSGLEGITPWSRQCGPRNDCTSMNHESISDASLDEQLELFDIVPDEPLPPPGLEDNPDDEPHMEWIQRQSEDGLRIFLQMLESTPGFRRP
jgi:hypothetical protein